jgi:hypothetical protein
MDLRVSSDHRPEFAIPITQPLWIEAATGPEGSASLGGYAIAVGWDRPQSTTFYLVSDDSVARPQWISEDDIKSSSIRRPV